LHCYSADSLQQFTQLHFNFSFNLTPALPAKACLMRSPAVLTALLFFLFL
jgi:hypothetical protein